MRYRDILYDVRERIATIVLNRPRKMNAWTGRMELEFRHAVADAEMRDDVRVIIVTGAGRGFCAGADVDLLRSVMSGNMDGGASGDHDGIAHIPDDRLGLNLPRKDFQTQYSFLPAVGKPVIAAVNGAAVGLGMVHALYCDIRFASEDARFGTAFARRGLIAEHGIAWLLPRLIGLQNAMDLLFSARLIDAREAKAMGLVSRILPADGLMEETRAYAAMLAEKSSPRSLRVMKRQIWHAVFSDLGSAIDVANEEMHRSFASEDFSEGVMSFLEKRDPVFHGR